MSDFEDNAEILREFLVESYENLDQLDRDLVVLEEDPSNREGLASVFRTIHTIKGTCGFLGLGKLESVAHVGESLLSRLRDGKMQLTTESTSALLAMVDAIRKMLASIETTASDGDDDYAELVDILTRLQDAEPPASAATPAAPPMPTTTATTDTPAALSTPTDTTPAAPAETADPRTLAVSETNIRVDVALLDKLMNLAGELVLARNQILQFAVTQSDTAFIATSQRLNLITTELQEGVMKTRMQPIGNVWSKFPRVVRDLAVTCGKQVRIEMEGEGTELDKTIIEAIKDPLTHVVRNSVDHGIETPEIRIAAGKSSEGRLFLRAYHEGGQVNIEISDDGNGIDPERLKEKALQRGLITPEQAGRMGEREVLNLIFLPGFSTAEKVTNVSGRGVGMDVVKTNIERIGGTVDIQSRPGHGTTLRVKIPLTLAIIPALIVTSGGGRYSIPQVSLLELVRLEGEEARKGVEMIHGAPVYRLRGELLPLVYLDHELNGDDSANPEDHDGAVNIVVLQAEDRHFGLVVHGINDTEEIVVKPLSKQLKGITSFAGATIMGDGKVALILDVLGLAQRSNVVSAVREHKLSDQGSRTMEQSDSRQTLLLFRIGADGRMAIPLSMVARLEEFPCIEIERAANQEVVQYRGQIMPLVRLASILKQSAAAPSAAPEVIQVVVYSEGGRSIGLVVDCILDIVQETLTINREVGRDGVLGSAVVQQRVTDLLDVQGVVRTVDPSFFAQAAA
jgi:two-component system chemotaxis sensor kinase CheA